MFTFERSREPFSLGKRSREPCPTCLCSSLSDTMFMFERSLEPRATWHLVYVRAESRTFLFGRRSREPFWHHVYVRAESRTFLTPCLCSSGVENLVYVRAESRTLFKFEPAWHNFTPCLCSSHPDTLFMFERSREPFLLGRRSREPCATCLRSSGVENLFATWHLVYVRTFITPCLRSSGVENPFRQAGGVENPTLLYSLFMFEPYWHHVYVRAESRTLFVRQAESRTLRYLFTFERSREPCATLLLVYARAESRTLRYLFMFERSREPFY